MKKSGPRLIGPKIRWRIWPNYAGGGGIKETILHRSPFSSASKYVEELGQIKWDA